MGVIFHPTCSCYKHYSHGLNPKEGNKVKDKPND